jgi:hypothetical protein
VKIDANFWIGIAVLVFTLGLVPGAIPPAEPNHPLLNLAESSLRDEAGGKPPSKADVDRRYNGFMAEQRIYWLLDIALLVLSIIAISLVVLRKKAGLWAVLVLSASMLLNYGPHWVLDLLSGRFITTASVLFSSGIQRGTINDALLFWHVVAAPFAYLLLAVATIFVLRHRALHP